MLSPLDRPSTAPSRFGHARRLLGLLAASLLCLYAILPAQASPAALSSPRSYRAVAAVPGAAPARLPDSPGFEYIGGFGGAVETVAISGTLAYIGQGPQLTVIDFAHPAPRAPIATLPLTTTLADIQVLGSRAYLVGHQLDLLILDVADPGHPVPLGSFDTPGVAEQVLVIGTRAYLAAGTQGLQILDLADPAHPALLGGYATQGAVVDVDVIGNRAYVVDTAAGLVILDIGTPAAPVKLGTYVQDDSGAHDDGKRVQVVGSRAYFLTAFGLLILDVGNPAMPVRLGSYGDLPENALQVVGTRVYTWRAILDVSNPAAPVEVGYYQGGQDVQVVGNLAYFAAGAEGLRVLDVTPVAPVLVDSYRTSSSAGGLHVAGDRVYLQDAAGLLVVDASNPAQPVIVGHHPMVTKDVDVAGDLAYVAGRINGVGGYNDVFILDVSTPSPTLRGAYATGSGYDSANGVEVVDDLAFVTTGGWRNGGLRILDVSDPDAPTLVSVTPMTNAAGIQVKGNLAYFSGAAGFSGPAGLQIMDVSAPEQPTILGSYVFTESHTLLQVAGDRAYLAGWEDGIQILDVTNPVTPTLLGSYATPVQVTGLELADDIAYITVGEHGVQALDVSDPAHPALLASYDTPGTATGIQIVDGLAYVADGAAGLHIFRLRLDLLPAGATIPAGGGSFANVDRSVALTIPPGALTETVTLSYTARLVTGHPLPADRALVRGFSLEARGADQAPIGQLTRPYTLTLNYTGAQLRAALVSAETLAVLAWDGQSWVELPPCAGCGLTLAGDRLIVVTDRFGEFALAGEQRRLFLPFIAR